MWEMGSTEVFIQLARYLPVRSRSCDRGCFWTSFHAGIQDDDEAKRKAADEEARNSIATALGVAGRRTRCLDRDVDKEGMRSCVLNPKDAGV